MCIRDRREQTAEGVPESRVGIHVSRQYLTVLGPVMQDIAVLVDLLELAREQGRTVEARIERAVLIYGSSRNLDASQHLSLIHISRCSSPKIDKTIMPVPRASNEMSRTPDSDKKL